MGQGRKVFCGGLPWKTDDEGLKDAMEQFGPVSEAKVVIDRETDRSKGFGFVTFETVEAAEEAISAGSVQIEGRKVNIDQANDSGRRGR